MVEVRAPDRYLPSAFDVDGLAVDAVSSALAGAAELAEARGMPRPHTSLDARHVACAFASERHLLRDGEPLGPGFAPLSRFAPTLDGWIRLHANYDHHRRALLSALGTDEAGALDAIGGRDALELETAIVAAGAAAAAVRTPAEWAGHPAGRAVPELVERIPGGTTDRRVGTAERGLPMAGVRVLDLTRVIAGPVATRYLAALGADVLRIDPPQLPELELGMLDGCPGKRLATLDLRHEREAFESLLAGADAVVHGYRPGALAAFGLEPESLAERHPHLVSVSLSAWGRGGPWGGRRGFDSLVQAACGIAATEGAPGALPVQALDHATGYLMAAATLRALAERERSGAAGHARLALAATAAELMRRPAPNAEGAEAVCDGFRASLGALSVIAPPGELDGRGLVWTADGRRDEPRWQARPTRAPSP